MRTILYLGTDPTQFETQGHFQGHVIHYPVIKIIPQGVTHPDLRAAYQDLPLYTHIIFTSKNAVEIFFQHMDDLKKDAQDFLNHTIIAIGVVTEAYLKKLGVVSHYIPEQETQEGLVNLLQTLDLKDAYFFLPRSSISRPVLVNYFQEKGIRFQACDLYETITRRSVSKPDLDQIDEIIFTSPSTVKAFIEIFGALPTDKTLLAVGPITEEALQAQLKPGLY